MTPAAVDSDAALERLRGLFRFFAATQCRGRSAVYEALSEGIARDNEVLALLLDAAADQRRPSLLFAAVNLLLAGDPKAELREYYPTHGGQRAVDAELMRAFTSFCRSHRDQLGRLLAERSTQTNEIRRCVALLLGLEHAQRRWPGSLALVEVGASAGLNLHFDRYHYRLTDHGARVTDTNGSTVISCEIKTSEGYRAHPHTLDAIPPITSRIGIDQQPIDLNESDARAWLEAFVWPEDVNELAVLRSAIGIARSRPDAKVIRGEATADTARLIADLPGREPVVVFTASLLSYLDQEAITRFVGQLDEAAEGRPVAWVFAESPGLLAAAQLDIPALRGPLTRRNSLYVVGTRMRGHGHAEDRILGLADPYLRWLAPARHEADDFHWVTEETPAH